MSSMMRRILQCLSLGSITILVLGADAHAVVSQKVKRACKNDYLAYCSQHAVGSPALRTCMRSAHNSLSKTCLEALVDDGEVSEEDISRHKTRQQR